MVGHDVNICTESRKLLTHKSCGDQSIFLYDDEDLSSSEEGPSFVMESLLLAVVAMMVFNQLFRMPTEALSCSSRCIKVVVHELFSEFRCSFNIFAAGVAMAPTGDYTV